MQSQAEIKGKGREDPLDKNGYFWVAFILPGNPDESTFFSVTPWQEMGYKHAV